jgi:hypothetical protein
MDETIAIQIGGYRMSHGRRDVTLGNETPGWPSQPPAALHGVIGNFPGLTSTIMLVCT